MVTSSAKIEKVFIAYCAHFCLFISVSVDQILEKRSY